MLSKEKENRKVCVAEGGGGSEKGIWVWRKGSHHVVNCWGAVAIRAELARASCQIVHGKSCHRLAPVLPSIPIHRPLSCCSSRCASARLRSSHCNFSLIPICRSQIESIARKCFSCCISLVFRVESSLGFGPLSLPLSLTSSLLLSLFACPAPAIYKFLFAFVKFERKRKNFEYGKLGSSINATNSNCSLKGTNELVWKKGTTFPLQLVSRVQLAGE